MPPGTKSNRSLVYAASAVTLLLSGCSVPIAGGLGEHEANEAIVALEHAGVYATKQPDLAHEGQWQLEVARGDTVTAVSVLSEENLPAPSTPGVLEAMGQGSLVPSRTLEHAKWLAGTAADLEASLRSVDGVLSAHVHLAAPVKSALESGDAASKPSASVLLRHRGATPPIAAGDVQRLVAGAVPGLEPEAVSVISSTAPPPSHRRDLALSQLGPVTVTQASLLPLKAILAGAIVLNLVLLSLLAWFWTRARRAQARLARLEVGEGAAGES